MFDAPTGIAIGVSIAAAVAVWISFQKLYESIEMLLRRKANEL